MSEKVYINRIFSRQVYEKDLSEIYQRPFNDYPWKWPYDCDGKPVYYYADDEQKHLYIEDDDDSHYGCHIDWTVEEEQMEHKNTITITDKYLHELIDTLQKVVADKDGDMLLMSRIEYAERLSAKATSPADGYPRDFLYNIVYYAILQNLRYKTIVYILYLYGCTVTGPEVENYEFLKS